MQKQSDDCTKINAESGPFDALIRLPKPCITASNVGQR
jgi:hypothetical protein